MAEVRLQLSKAQIEGERMETAIADNSFKTLGCEWKERDKRIAPGGLKEVKGSFYLLKMGQNFTCLNTVGKES